MKRKLIFLNSFHCDILIFDTIGSSWIKECLPPKCTVGNIEIRDHLPLLLSIRFLFRLIKNLFRLKNDVPYYRSLLWLSSLFETINPRIILTCADNNQPLSRYADNNPNTKVIFLQNAIRDTIGSIPHRSLLPTYLSLGQIESEMFKSIGINYKELIPVGSVKLGLALAHHNPLSRHVFDLCFISHYRPEMLSDDSSNLFKQIEISHRSLFKNVMSYASTRNLSVVVLSKTRETVLQNSEYDYFLCLANQAPFKFIRGNKNTDEFSTYRAALSSDLVIHPASTLGFEMFSAGKKVLFGASQKSGLLRRWGINHYFDALPAFVKLTSTSQREFDDSCDNIRRIPTSDYLNSTKECAREIIALSEHEYPHEVVRRMLIKLLER